MTKMIEPFIGRDGSIIKPPNLNMDVSERANQIWRVHPSDLDKMGFRTRVEFYEAHLNAAIEQSKI
jgi:hypothetical protein